MLHNASLTFDTLLNLKAVAFPMEHNSIDHLRRFNLSAVDCMRSHRFIYTM